jgi:hypothetical protein
MDIIDDDNNAAKIFLDDTYTKKQIVNSSVRVCSTKNKQLVPNKKELNKLNGEVKTVNMYDELIPYEEFTKLKKEEKIKILKHWFDKKGVTRQQLATHWGRKTQAIHDMIYRLGITDKREDSKPKQQPVIEDNSICPFSLYLLRFVESDSLLSWINNALELADKDKLHEFNFSLSKNSGKMNLNVNVQNTMTCEDFLNEVSDVLAFISGDNRVQVSFSIKEVV